VNQKSGYGHFFDFQVGNKFLLKKIQKISKILLTFLQNAV